MRDNQDSADTPRYGLETMLVVDFGGGNASGAQTESFAVTDFGPPASYQVDLVLFHFGHSWIPRAYQLHVLVDSLGFDAMEDDRVDVFASRKDLRKGSFDFLVHLAAFWCTVD